MDERHRPWWIGGLLAAYLLLAATLPGLDDEIYYWCWSKELQWSYYDHPPMTAVLIHLSTAIFGDNVFGIRFPACVATAIVVGVISRWIRSWLFFIALLICPQFNLGAVLMTPDSPLVLFWTLYVWWLIELQRRFRSKQFIDAAQSRSRASLWGWWTVGGVLLGCGVLSKYTMALAVPACFVSLWMSRQRFRDWFPAYVYHGAVSFLVASPILIFNITRQFEPLLFQLRHASQQGSFGVLSFGDFIGTQMLLFGTMSLTLLPWALVRFRRLCRSTRLRVCASFYCVPLLFFLYKSTQARLEANWALVCFVSFWPLADTWYRCVCDARVWRTLTPLAFLPPAVAVLFLAIHLTVPIGFIPIDKDRIYRQIAIHKAVRQLAEKIRERGEQLTVYAPSYQLTALLRFQDLDARQEFDERSRRSHFTEPPQHLADASRAYFVAGVPLPPESTAGMTQPELIASVPVEFRGRTDVTLHVWRYSKSDRP